MHTDLTMANSGVQTLKQVLETAVIGFMFSGWQWANRRLTLETYLTHTHLLQKRIRNTFIRPQWRNFQHYSSKG